MAAILPWEAIRKEYVEGQRDSRGGVIYPTQDELARKYTCGFGTIKARAQQERWAAARKAYQMAQVAQQTDASEEQAREYIDASALIETSARECAARGIAKITAFLDSLPDGVFRELEHLHLMEIDLCSQSLERFRRIVGNRSLDEGELPPAA